MNKNKTKVKKFRKLSEEEKTDIYYDLENDSLEYCITSRGMVNSFLGTQYEQKAKDLKVLLDYFHDLISDFEPQEENE